MHQGWIEDTAETLQKVFESDYKATLIDDLVTEPAENKKIRNVILDILPIFLDIFHLLQARSKNYPLIDAIRIKEDFIDNLETHQKNNY